MGIGAGRVARAAEDTELSANQAPPNVTARSIRLALAIDEVRWRLASYCARNKRGWRLRKNDY